jgi:hypothetical protein
MHKTLNSLLRHTAIRNATVIALAALFFSLAIPCLLKAEDFKPLFNGKDLSGWVLVNTPPQTWSIQDGMLICSGKPIGEIRTERMYQNFELELEWRHMVPGGNAGIFVWADDITARGVPFHRGVEVQVLENAYGNTQGYSTHGDIFPIHGAEMTPINGRGGNRAFPTELRSKPSPEWNHYRIVCNDGNISLSVNGKEVTKGTKASPSKGYICIESEGGIVHYRNVRIKELPDTPVDAKNIATANRGFRSIYSGLDLVGWKIADNAKARWEAKDWVLTYRAMGDKQPSRLEYAQPVRIAGFVVDFRFSDASAGLNLIAAGFKSPISIRNSEESNYYAALEKQGSWNRIIGEVSGDKMKLLINGKSFELPYSNSEGAFALESLGDLDLANIYIR